MLDSVLLIGYGNSLRGDDGVGQNLAAEVASWGKVKTYSVHQLTPDLAQDISDFDLVIFADASADSKLVKPQLKRLEVKESASSSSHYADPKSLLELAQTLYGKAPEAYILGLPAECFELGSSLSNKAQQGLNEGLECLKNLLQRKGYKIES
jgi:hydrogenase maturation protease